MNWLHYGGLLMAFMSVGLISASCKPEQRKVGPVYQADEAGRGERIYYFAVNPLHNPIKLVEAYQPLLDDLNHEMSGVKVELEASRDFARFEQKIRSRQPDMIRPNPWQTLVALQSGYHVVAMEGAAEDFRGLIIVRKDSDILQPTDLKGRSVSYPSPTSFSACIMPQLFLQNHGVNISTDIDNRYVGSQESSIMNVFLKLTAAGATWPLSWRSFQKEHPEEASDLKVMWETDYLINSSIMIRNDIPAKFQEDLMRVLTNLQTTVNGRVILGKIGIDQYRIASDRDYDVVRKYVAEFEKKVRIIAE